MGTPIRKDMETVWREGRPRIAYHLHLYGTGLGALMRWFGQRGWLTRTHPTADESRAVKGGHSGILRDSKHMAQIDQVLDRIQNPAHRDL